jgi:hypothetical protein
MYPLEPVLSPCTTGFPSHIPYFPFVHIPVAQPTALKTNREVTRRGSCRANFGGYPLEKSAVSLGDRWSGY